ncbi:MAG: cupin domain-containing protein [Chitinophagaceae bacterium]|nr:cupin domain-containing protein [Chitinophagaceae bacterium]
MMKLLFITFIFCSFIAAAQTQTNIGSLIPKEAYENISSQLLNSDSNVTSIVIWIKKEVKPHVHTIHSEQVYVLEGTGKMLLGEKTMEVKPGDLIFIPKQTIHALKVTSATPMKVLSIQAPEFDGKDRVFVEREW